MVDQVQMSIIQVTDVSNQGHSREGPSESLEQSAHRIFGSRSKKPGVSSPACALCWGMILD